MVNGFPILISANPIGLARFGTLILFASLQGAGLLFVYITYWV